MQFNNALELDTLDIDNYLPIKTSEDAIKFCSNDDGLLEQRKKATMRRIYSVADVSSMAAFVASVTDLLFHLSFQIAHRWPAKQ